MGVTHNKTMFTAARADDTDVVGEAESSGAIGFELPIRETQLLWVIEGLHADIRCFDGGKVTELGDFELSLVQLKWDVLCGESHLPSFNKARVFNEESVLQSSEACSCKRRLAAAAANLIGGGYPSHNATSAF